MDIDSATQAWECGVCGGWWGCLKALPEKSKSKFLNFTSDIKKTAQADPRRVIHSLKVGLALTLVSFLYYVRPLYDSFGVDAIWAVLTVVLVFEFTVGASLSKSMNRGFATLLASALGVGGLYLAKCFGDTLKPFVLGILVFILAAGFTFFRFVPRIKAKYDYGVMIFIMTFSLVAVSAQRFNDIFFFACQRLYTILIGGAICIVIALFVCPVWAGQDLHNLIASNLEKLANFLQGFGCAYFECSEGSKDNTDKSVLEGYISVLNSKASEESLANFAWWEPGHGRFRLFHPWSHYVKIGALARQCAYKFETLDRYLTPEIQVSLEFKGKIQEPCKKLCWEASKALKALSSSIKTMTEPCNAEPHLENSKKAIKDLKIALENTSLEDELITIIPVVTVASILIETTKCLEKIHDSVSELSHLAHFRTVKSKVSVSAVKPHLLHRGHLKPFGEGDGAHHVHSTIQEPNGYSLDISAKSNSAYM